MHFPRLFTRVSLFCFYSLLAVALSCIKDHDLSPPANLPESACLTIGGTPRAYPCEFVIEKVSILAEDGSVLAEVLGANPDPDKFVSPSRGRAKRDSNPGAAAVGEGGDAVFDARMTLKRVARPSFPVTAGYQLSATSNSARAGILHTPGERFNIGTPFALDMPVGETRDVTFEISVPYEISNVGGGVIRPTARSTNTKMFFIENDNTTLQFNRRNPPYTFVGSVVEDYIRVFVSINR
ncbi:hypothetical protein [Persicitalea sp.]|uniref:hypothetical protein n=1 Tax=Persicitalea sp. TaxID=3100273 RepID=UPI003593616C